MQNDRIELIKKARRILINLATNRKTITYSELADRLDLPTSGNALGNALGPILLEVLKWTQFRGMPPITVIVVNKSGNYKGQPGVGFWRAIGREHFTDMDKSLWTPTIIESVFKYWEIDPDDKEPFEHLSGWLVKHHPDDQIGDLRLYNRSEGIAYVFRKNKVNMSMLTKLLKDNK